jgi:ribosomal protein L14
MRPYGSERSNIVRAVIVRTKKTIKRSDGMAVRFDDNMLLISTKIRVLNPVAREMTNDLQNYFISKRSSMNKRKIAM